MKIIRAETAGFCMGVALALEKLDKAIEHKATHGQHNRIVTLGPIIHNPQVLAYYADKGVSCIDSVDEVHEGDCVLIRAHGIPKNMEEHLQSQNVNVIDATCPKVKKAQLAIANATRQGQTLLLFGEAQHPEVRGLVSYASAKGGAWIFESLQDLQTLELAPHKSFVLASQTTQDKNLFDNIKKYLLEHLGDIPVLSTICHATRQRQEDIVRIAHTVDAVVVVGGKESGNTRRLADVAEAVGVATWHVETADELQALQEKFASFVTVGLTAGASTPKRLIDAVHGFLKNLP